MIFIRKEKNFQSLEILNLFLTPVNESLADGIKNNNGEHTTTHA